MKTRCGTTLVTTSFEAFASSSESLFTWTLNQWVIRHARAACGSKHMYIDACIVEVVSTALVLQTLLYSSLFLINNLFFQSFKANSPLLPSLMCIDSFSHKTHHQQIKILTPNIKPNLKLSIFLKTNYQHRSTRALLFLFIHFSSYSSSHQIIKSSNHHLILQGI